MADKYLLYIGIVMFNRVGIAPRFVFQISNTKCQIEQARPDGHAVKRITFCIMKESVPGSNIRPQPFNRCFIVEVR